MQLIKRYTTEQALQRAKHYCAYQERCHKEVREKVYSFGLRKKEVEELITKLIEENYMNEERFALQFALGKFNLKHWGKEKIKQALKQKEISAYCIDKALNAIDETGYAKTFEKLAAKKLSTLKSEKNIFIKKTKLQNYLLQKGYERDLIMEYMRSM